MPPHRWVRLLLFIAQGLCRIDSCNSQSWHSGGNERYKCKQQDDCEDRGQVIDAYSIEYAAHHSQSSRAKDIPSSRPSTGAPAPERPICTIAWPTVEPRAVRMPIS